MTKNQRLYNELRKFVDIKKVLDYDNEFFDNKKRSYKFMIPFLEKYINIKLFRNKITDPKAHSHLVDLEFKTANPKKYRELNKVKGMPRHADKHFLFKDNK
ncbi:hypothetical protein N8831_02520 [Flavobacteriaceae bacterium]|nr:hypothetical protein [Flavobacteriaceae bacterium]